MHATRRPLTATRPLLGAGLLLLTGCQALIDVDHPLTFDAAGTTPGAADTGREARGDGLAPFADAFAGDALRPPPPDLSLRPPSLDFETPPLPDHGLRPGDPDAADAAPPPPPPEDCHDTADNDLDLLADCADPDCAGEPCDDGEACTYDDRCDPGPGTCQGTTLTCESTPCMLRGCTGGPACAETPVEANSPCPDDGDPCTVDRCDGAGACVPARLPDGAQCGGEVYELRCCGGACVNVFTDDANCGGCGISCGGRNCIADFVDLIPRISCRCQGSNAQCQAIHPDYTCYQNRCNCLSDAACGEGMTCVNITNSPNSCVFP